MFGLVEYNDIDKVRTCINKNVNNFEQSFIDYIRVKGAQGITGLISFDSNETIHLFKISKHMDFTVSNEYNVMEAANQLRKYNPHFCVSFGKYRTDLSSYYYERKENPFIKPEIQLDTLIVEYIEGTSFTKLINKVSLDTLMSCLKQVLLAIDMAQRDINLTHYDLHTDNILVHECDKNSLFVYVLSNTEQYCVPSHGKVPVIIDYGFSYTKDSRHKPLYSTMEHTDSGYLGCVFDRIHDTKVLMIGLAHDMEQTEARGYKTIRNITDQVFGKLSKVNWEKGWDDGSSCSALEFVSFTLSDQITSDLIVKHLNTFLVMVQTLIILPLRDQETNDVIHPFNEFQQEFSKIQIDIKDEFNLLYIIRTIIDIIRPLRNEYEKEPRKVAGYLRNKLQDAVSALIPFYEFPNDLNYEKLIGSLYDLSTSMETVYYRVMDDIKRDKNKQYRRLNCQFPVDVFEVIEREIPCVYKLNLDTQIYYWDSVKKTYYTRKMNPMLLKECQEIIESDENNVSRRLGELLYQKTKR